MKDYAAFIGVTCAAKGSGGVVVFELLLVLGGATYVHGIRRDQRL